MSGVNLAKNTSFFTLALAIQKVLSFGYFIFIARAIGVENMGRFSFALSFTTVFAMVLDAGLTQILIRESARNRDQAQNYLVHILGIKLLASLFVYALVIVMVNVLGYPELTRQLVYIAGVVMMIDSFSLSLYGVLRGQQNLSFESFGVVINQLIVIAVGIVVVVLDLSLPYLMLTYLCGSIFNFGLAASAVVRKYQFKLAVHFEMQTLRKIVIAAIPFALAGLFIRLYSSMDIIFLSKMSTDYAVGIYSAAYKMAFALQFIGIAFSASMYPAFSRFFVDSREKLSQSFMLAMRYLTILAMPLAAGVIVTAPAIVGPVFGSEYQDAVKPLVPLMIALIFAFWAFPATSLLNAANRQGKNTLFLGITALTNAVANLALIPLFDYTGAAIATVISYATLFVLCIVTSRSIISYRWRELFMPMAQAGSSSLLMAVAAYLLLEDFSVFMVIPFSMVAYVVALYGVRGFKISDLTEMHQLIFKRS
jgi:O-antigen/teichoic acid export membrane protein